MNLWSCGKTLHEVLPEIKRVQGIINGTNSAKLMNAKEINLHVFLANFQSNCLPADIWFDFFKIDYITAVKLREERRFRRTEVES